MDPRDLAENEISEAENIVMDQRKSVRPLGGDTAHTDVGSGLVAGHITPGYGAFVFESDHEKGIGSESGKRRKAEIIEGKYKGSFMNCEAVSLSCFGFSKYMMGMVLDWNL